MFFGPPYTIDHVLDVQDKISLTVPRITERHVRRISLRNRRQSQVGWPGLDQDHVACNETGGIRTTPRISLAIEDNRTVTVGGVPKNLVEKHSETIQVADVQRTEICVKGIVEESIINREKNGRPALAGGIGLGPALAWRLVCLLRERERSP